MYIRASSAHRDREKIKYLTFPKKFLRNSVLSCIQKRTQNTIMPKRETEADDVLKAEYDYVAVWIKNNFCLQLSHINAIKGSNIQ